MTTLDLLREKWDDVRAALKARWGDKITDAELDEVAGQREKLCHLLGEKCKLGEQAANREINIVLDGLGGI